MEGRALLPRLGTSSMCSLRNYRIVPSLTCQEVPWAAAPFWFGSIGLCLFGFTFGMPISFRVSQASGVSTGQQAPQQAAVQVPAAGSSRSLNAIIIAAAVTGGVCGLCALLVLGAAWRLRKRRREEEQQEAVGTQKRKVGAAVAVRCRVVHHGWPAWACGVLSRNKGRTVFWLEEADSVANSGRVTGDNHS